MSPKKIENKLSIIRREYYALTRIPKPKPPPTQENFKIDDLLKNKTSIEEMMVRNLENIFLEKSKFFSR